MREIRTLRATWRGLETWCGSGLPGHTGAPALDPTIKVFDEAKTGRRIVGVDRQAKQRNRAEFALDDASRFQFARAFGVHASGDFGDGGF